MPQMGKTETNRTNKTVIKNSGVHKLSKRYPMEYHIMNINIPWGGVFILSRESFSDHLQLFQ